ncbi:unnamed protein product [Bursaphelenchus okinawaensis]|uniref:Uncharacterized protein n=1 Tax=Bursaphelenchus okinawaensis TaxID=465554 RepID=A0A811L363_9BILA|nr:unnamed protein product [Bursaphelenchus okinawaensis]CAG9115504.1 unnamed protein product [Bursaphelenchus okinawaensis]
MSVDQLIDQSSRDFEQVRSLFASQRLVLSGRAEPGNVPKSASNGLRGVSKKVSPSLPRRPSDLPPLPRKPVLPKKPSLPSKADFSLLDSGDRKSGDKNLGGGGLNSSPGVVKSQIQNSTASEGRIQDLTSSRSGCQDSTASEARTFYSPASKGQIQDSTASEGHQQSSVPLNGRVLPVPSKAQSVPSLPPSLPSKPSESLVKSTSSKLGIYLNSSVRSVAKKLDSQLSHLTGNMLPSILVENGESGPNLSMVHNITSGGNVDGERGTDGSTKDGLNGTSSSKNEADTTEDIVVNDKTPDSVPNLPSLSVADTTKDLEDSESDYEEVFEEFPSRKNSVTGRTKQLHSSIMEEMKTKGILRKLSTVQPILSPDVGRMRPQSSKINRTAQNWCKSEPPVPLKTESFDGGKDRRLTQQFLSVTSKSRIGCPSILESSPSTSTLSEDVDLEIFEYNVEGEKERHRLKDLHGLIHEFYKMQKNYVELLRNIAVYFPNYIDGFIRRTNRQALTPPTDGRPHVLERLARHLNLILNVHQVFLTEFGQKYQKWDSRYPDFASVFLKLADYLKICSEFLKEKQSICEELTKALEDNRDLAHVTKLFEDEVLNAQNNADQFSSNPSLNSFTPRGISLVMHLDGVHQNVVRYNLLMERYKKLLPDDIEEYQVADKALTKLKSISEAINVRLADADSNRKMMDLHRKLQGCFDVFAPGRRLVYESRLMKQSRRELQERHLVLFTDYLLICRYSLGSDYFDTQRIYRIPVEQLRIHVEDHADYDREFAVINPKKSHVFICKSRNERDQWMKHLDRSISSWKTMRKERRARSEYQPDPRLSTIESTASTPVAEDPVKDALWIPDNKATKCLMNGCESKFSVVLRRHHCRNCGWLICRRCVGYAPVRAKQYESVKVCPECFDRLWLDFFNLRLFPLEMVQIAKPTLLTQMMTNPGLAVQNTIGSVWNYPSVPEEPEYHHEELVKIFRADPLDDSIRIMYDNGRRAERPKDLFKPPQNQHLRRVMAPLTEQEMVLVTGRVLLRKRGEESVKWARFHQSFFLNFYDAEFDNQPVESYLILGFSLEVKDAENGGSIFVLEHQNQIKTDRKSIHIEFRIENSKAVDKWQEVLEQHLPKPDSG